MPPDAKDAKQPAKASADASKVTMADIQPDAPDTYTVVKGDTLWGIAGRFLKDPWKWPQVWEMNRDQIKDPHWIYPGDVIRLDKSGASPRLTLGAGGAAGAGASMGPSGGTASDAAGNLVRLQPRTRIESLTAAIPSIPGNAIGPFLAHPLVVEAGGLDTAPMIVATEERRVVVGAGNSAYADRIGPKDPVNWQVFRPATPLLDPETGEVLGYEAKYVGDARVMRYGNPSTVEITKARQEINNGDRLAPARETSFPSYVPRAPDKPIKGAIMSVEGGVSELGQFQIITLNRGSRDGVEVGHVLASYRRGDVLTRGATDRGFTFGGGNFLSGLRNWWRTKVASDSAAAAPTPSDPPPATGTLTLPDERAGLVFVFRVYEKLSYAMVMRSTRPIYIGDVVQNP